MSTVGESQNPTAPEAPAAVEWTRHPSDVARLIFSLVVVAILVLTAQVGDSEVRSLTLDLLAIVDGLPRALAEGLVGLVQLIATAMVPTVVVVLLLRRRFRLLLICLLAAGIALLTMPLLASVIDGSVPIEALGYERVNSWFVGSQYPSATYLAAATAVLVAASPWMGRSWRVTGWVFLIACVFARIVTATDVPLRNMLLLAVGGAAGSLTLVVFGAPRRRVDLESVTAGLEAKGLAAEAIVPVSDHDGVPTFEVREPGGRRLFVKVLGRDQRDTNLLVSLWTRLTVKGVGGGSVIASPSRAVQSEALAASIFSSVGARTASPIAVFRSDEDTAVLVTTFVDGMSLARCEADQVSDAALSDLWRQVALLQRRRLAHRRFEASNLLVTGDAVTIVDLGVADLDADDEALGADVAQLLAATASVVGVDAAVHAAAEVLGTDELARAVPFIQRAVFTGSTREHYEKNDERLVQLREQTAEQAGIEQVEIAPVQRITIGGAVSLVGSLVLLGYVFNLASNWEQMWEAFTEADLTYVIPIVALMISTYLSGALSLVGAVTIDLAYVTTCAVMFGQSFLNRFTPANAGGMAMRVRYLQLNGLDTSVAASSIALTSAASGVAQAIMIVTFLVWGGASDRLSDFDSPDFGSIVIIILVVGLVVAVVLATTWGREVARPWITAAATKIREAVAELIKNPKKMAQLFGGALLGKLANIMSFWLSLLAFGVDIGFAKTGAMYLVATTIGSAVPTPGGVGGVEAALTAALIGYGVDNGTAAAIVLFFRTLTFWLPTLPGYGFLRYTQAKGIV